MIELKLKRVIKKITEAKNIFLEKTRGSNLCDVLLSLTRFLRERERERKRRSKTNVNSFLCPSFLFMYV